MIEAKNICFHYKGFPDTIKNVSFRMEEGDFLAILGNNGVGKSTLLKCFNGILNADSGSFSLGDVDIFGLSKAETAKKIAFVSQDLPDTALTVRDVVMLGRKPHMKWSISAEDRKIVDDCLKRLNLVGMSGRFLNRLSGGERQKVMIARALAQQPQLLLLDEPTSSLDICNQLQVLNIVSDICKSDGISAIMVIHDLSLALRFCNRFLLLSHGQVYRYGDYPIIDSQALEDVYGVNAYIKEVDNQKTLIIKN